MGLFARVSADVASLVLEAVEGFITKRALVGTGQILARLFLCHLLLAVLEERRHEAHGCGSHGGLDGQGGRKVVVW